MSATHPLLGLTDDPNAVAQYILNLLVGQVGTRFQSIFFGDQANIPGTPTLCVEPGPMQSDLAGAPMVLANTITVYILIYHSKIQDNQVTKEEIGEMAHDVRNVLHSDLTMGGLIINGFVTSVEPGYSSRGNALFKTTRITWTGQTRVSIMGG